MCGRFALTLPPDAIRQVFAYQEQPNFPPRHNIAPTQPIAIVRAERKPDGGMARHFALVRWGLIPSWLKEVKNFPLLFNARAEGIDSKASFRGSFRHRRCIVMADAFYEWQRLPGGRGKTTPRPFLIRRIDGQTMALAGLWEDWLGADGSQIETACIVTVHANGLMAGLHERMPAILDPADFDAWLDTDATRPEAALRLLRPGPDDLLEALAIGTAVNSVANEGPELQVPTGERLVAEPAREMSLPRQGELF